MLDVLLYGLVAPLAVILVFGALVFIHELGHYTAGRACGVGVEEFAIGFGPKLVSLRDRHGTLWVIRALPLGGFVRFVGDGDASSRPLPRTPQAKAPVASMEARLDALASKPLWQRAIVVAAGPAANIALAFVLLMVHFSLIGQRVSEPVLARVELGSAGAAAGLQAGDRILEISGTPISTAHEAELLMEGRLGAEVPLRVRRDGDTYELRLTPTPGVNRSGSFSASGLWAHFPLSVERVETGSPAEQMGLQAGDIVSGYDGQLIYSFQRFADARAAAVGRDMTLAVRRGQQILRLTGRPERREYELQNGKVVQSIGFGFISGDGRDHQLLALTPSAQKAWLHMGQTAFLVFKLPGQFIRQQRTLSDLAGPVQMAETIGRVALNAPQMLLLLAALISLQLGILNLFPIPILDGGHLLLFSAEAVLRRPLPPRLVIWLYRLGGAFLLSFFVLIFLNDIRVLFVSS